MYSRSILSLTLSFSGWNLAPNVPAVVQKNSWMHLRYAVKADDVIIAASDGECRDCEQGDVEGKED